MFGNEGFNGGGGIPQEVAQAVQGLSGLGVNTNLEFEPTARDSGVLQLKSTGRQGVRFYWKEFYNAFETIKVKDDKKAAGDYTPVVPVYDKVLMIEIHTPGEGKPFEGRCEEYHKRTYFQHLKRFLEGKNEMQGTPIENAEFLISAEAMDLRLAGVKTIEMLADAGDVLCESTPRGHELREHARMWVTVNHGDQLAASTKKLSADLHSAQSTIEALKKESESNRQAMAEMREMVKQVSMGNNIPTDLPNAEDFLTTSAEDFLNTSEPVKRSPGRPKQNV